MVSEEVSSMGDYETSLWIVLGVWTFFMISIAAMLLKMDSENTMIECMRGIAAVFVILILFVGVLTILELKVLRWR